MSHSIIIAEDEQLSADLLEKIISEISDTMGSLNIVAICHSGEEAIAAVTKHEPDILFLDVNMPQGDGFTVVDAINAHPMTKRPAIIFTTAHSRFAVRAFDVQASDYLLKPLSNERVIRALKRVMGSDATASHADAGDAIMIKVPTKKGSEYISAINIDAMESSGDYIYIYTDNRKLMLRGTLRDYSEKLKLNFYQTHRSYLVKLDSITAVHNNRNGSAIAILDSGAEIPISRRYRAGLIRLLPHIL